MMKISPIYSLVALAVCTAICACGCMSQEVVVSDEERMQVLEYAEPVTDNLLQGFNENNYTQYSQDFSQVMKESLDEGVFERNRELVVSRIGLYVSRDDNPVVTEKGEYIAVNYKATFEQEEGVDVRVVFRKGDDSHQVDGLWFNSPKLRS
jgi:hypothetical protein